ncbi:MAG: hypothetical protein JEZ00_08250 [Anaerolineaceae bacterium]|nr:hypothetical protein [Anaerolineaceae bacterium]
MNLYTISSKLKIYPLIALFCIIVFIASASAPSPTKGKLLLAQSTKTTEPIQEETPSGNDTDTTLLTTTPTETITSTPTPFPDWAMTSKDTNGLLFAGILILLIIILGTLTAITRNIPIQQK